MYVVALPAVGRAWAARHPHAPSPPGAQQFSGSEAEPDAGLENQYYNAKQLRDESAREAIACFEKVVQLESPKGDWGFKALK